MAAPEPAHYTPVPYVPGQLSGTVDEGAHVDVQAALAEQSPADPQLGFQPAPFVPSNSHPLHHPPPFGPSDPISTEQSLSLSSDQAYQPGPDLWPPITASTPAESEQLVPQDEQQPYPHSYPQNFNYPEYFDSQTYAPPEGDYPDYPPDSTHQHDEISYSTSMLHDLSVGRVPFAPEGAEADDDGEDGHGDMTIRPDFDDEEPPHLPLQRSSSSAAGTASTANDTRPMSESELHSRLESITHKVCPIHYITDCTKKTILISACRPSTGCSPAAPIKTKVHSGSKPLYSQYNAAQSPLHKVVQLGT